MLRLIDCSLPVFCALLLVVGTTGPEHAAAQSVRGLVFDAVTDEAIPLATVTLVSESGERVASALTTEDGFFSLDAPDNGIYVVRGVALGYRPGRAGPVQLVNDGLQVVELRLETAPVELEGLTVEGESVTGVGNSLTQRGFWERYEEGRGQFLSPGDIAASDAAFTPHLLRPLNHVIAQHGSAPWAIWPQLRRATGSERGPCEPYVYVDNVWVNRPINGLQSADFGLEDIVPIDIVEAIEVYWGPFQAPMRYQGSRYENECGVILVWTR